MKQLEVTAIQRGCVYDGMGVRTTVFLKGCPFSCPWCCNPETLYSSPLFFIDNQKCIKEKGLSSSLCRKCIRNGGFDTLECCPFGVSEATRRLLSVEELANYLLRDKDLFYLSGGGVTFSGGEPIIHIPNLLPLLEILNSEQINCTMETTLYCKNDRGILGIIPYVDEWIVDLKLQQENYREDYDDVIMHNLQILRDSNANILYRLVFIDSMDANEIVKRLKKIDVLSIEVLKCHALAESKYHKLGLSFKGYVPSEKYYSDFVNALLMVGIETKKVAL